MLHQHAREGGKYEGRMSGDLDAMGIGRLSAGSSIPGGPGAGPSSRVRVPGLPRSGSSGSFGTRDFGVGDPGAGPSNSRARVPETPRPGSSDVRGSGDPGAGPFSGAANLGLDNPDAGHLSAWPSNREP